LSFDNFTLLIEVDKKQNMIYKHAISTIVPAKPIPYREEFEGVKDESQEVKAQER
jgi:host factor-I protein